MIVVPMYANPLQIFWGGQPPHWHWSSMVINSFHVRVPESKDQACQKGLVRDASTFTAQPPTGWTTCNGQRPPTLGGRTSVWKLDFTLVECLHFVVPMCANALQIFWGGQPPHWRWSSMVINSSHVRVHSTAHQICTQAAWYKLKFSAHLEHV